MREKKQRNIAYVTSFEKRLIPLIVFVEIFGKKRFFHLNNGSFVQFLIIKTAEHNVDIIY